MAGLRLLARQKPQSRKTTSALPLVDFLDATAIFLGAAYDGTQSQEDNENKVGRAILRESYCFD